MRNQSCPGARLRYGDRKRIRAIVLLADYEPGSSNMTDNEDAEPQSSTTPYLCNLISALSVGCIGVAFGTFVDSQWRTLILETGIIGAFAALGLSKAERYRRATVTERKRQANKAAAELRLNSAVVALVPIDQSSNAVGNILFDRTMADRPVLAITTLDPHNKGQTISAHLKDVSTWALGFIHQDELPRGPAAVTFVINDEPISLEVNICWSRTFSKKLLESGGYLTGAGLTQQAIDSICKRQTVVESTDELAAVL